MWSAFKKDARLLVPYAAWLSYATILNLAICRLNPRASRPSRTGAHRRRGAASTKFKGLITKRRTVAATAWRWRADHRGLPQDVHAARAFRGRLTLPFRCGT